MGQMDNGANAAMTAGAAADAKSRRMRRRVLSSIKPSNLVKDVTVGGVAFVAIKITYIYLKQLGTRPELLAAMGPRLIVDILGICIVGVILNRGLDLVGDLMNRFVDAFSSGIDRMASSAERTAVSADRTAISAAEGAIAQRDSAAAQQALAYAQQQQTTVMERVAANGDRSITEIQTVQTFQVSQGKIFARELKHTQHTLMKVAEHLGVKTAEKADEQHDND